MEMYNVKQILPPPERRGGLRANAGRIPDNADREELNRCAVPLSATGANKLAIEEAHKTGLLPHEFLLKISRGYKIDGKKPDLNTRISCAKAAAPYYAPKLSAVELIKDMTDAELDAIIKGTAAETGLEIQEVGK